MKLNPETWQLIGGLLVAALCWWVVTPSSFGDIFGVLWCAVLAGLLTAAVQRRLMVDNGD